MNRHSIPQAVIDTQHAASNPETSAWVSANAGAGKTHVLAERVIRLLLAGTPPEKILCLTFTKAAAANMANRIFDTLRQWIALGDTALDEAISRTGAKTGTKGQRERGRRLFAAALETPGGLKVQTIHGFCTRLLQQFPFEANVPARFRVLEEFEQQQMLEQLRRAMLFEASGNPDSAIGRALVAIIPAASDYGFQEGLLEAIRERERLLEWVENAGGLSQAAEQLSESLDIAPDDTLEAVEKEILDGPHLPSSEWLSVAGVCSSGSTRDNDQADRLREAIAAVGRTRVEAYLEVFYSPTTGQQRAALITGAIVQQYPELDKRLTAEKDRLPALCERRKAVMIRDRTVALMTLALQVIEQYRSEKNRRGLLDYDDLIARTAALLENVDARWVHHKLDLGIDHLLIDEAQDTSPEQWGIIKKFVEEFTAGAGARSQIRRTIFAVGDDKQSIFSFQGARPLEFDETRTYFERAHNAADLAFEHVRSTHSFRSVPLVLSAVDAVFKQEAAHAGLTADPVETVHQAVRAASPGLVELWDLERPDEKQDIDPWDQPFDKSSETSPRVKLARKIARAVKQWLQRGDPVGDDDKRHPMRAGDVLILVRQRGPLFEAIIRALKSADVAVAGADRLQLVEHIAIMDLLALADALLHGRDTLALATVLKSPLFGLTDDELYVLTSQKGSLRAALRATRPEIAETLSTLGDEARTLPPFTFYARLLGSGARKRFLSRLGAEANDALDEFLNLALAYESRQTPSLQGFVHWLRTASTEVKRDMEIARDEVRVMTVHGAKGLEAPVVILADTTTEPAGPPVHHPRLLSLPPQAAPPGTPDRIVWMTTKKEDTAPVTIARATMVRENENEYRRLLYVAMTRAADRLIVCGSVGRNRAPDGCWYQLIEEGLAATGELHNEIVDGVDVRRYRKSALETGKATPPTAVAPPSLPGWLAERVKPEPPRSKLLRPSDPVDDEAHAFAGVTERRRALARGTHVHRLMQSLPDVPPAGRADAARRYLARQGKLDDERTEIAAHTLRLLGDLRFDKLFLPGSRAEVSIVGQHNGHGVSGQIDRLVVTADEVQIVDYKTNRPAPKNVAEAIKRHPAYVRQLALYRAVLKRLYPGRPVRAALLWTDTPDLMEIPAADLDAALAILTTS